MSLVSLHGDSGSSSLECDNCESGDPPVNRCAACCHFLCEFCTAAHKRGRGTKTHRLLSLEEAKEEGPVAVTRPSLCKEHDGEILKLFCETCDEAICRDCTIVKHCEHKYTFVKDAFSKGKESVLKILSETKTKESVLQEALDGVTEVKRSVQSNAERTVKEVFDCFQELTTCLNIRCNELICSIEELKKAKLKSLEIQQGDLETALGSVQSSVEFTERALEHGSEVDILNMRKQMSCRLQELNSARWQLEPSAHDHFKFLPDYQLQQTLPIFGEVTDVFTHAGSSTVTMGHGSEGVMYNTLNGQLIEFFITAKDWNGRKRTEGGDVFVVEISTQEGEVVFNNPAMDCRNGTYSFCFTPIHGVTEYQLSVKLDGCHVRGSSFAWFNEIWNLYTEVHNNYQYPHDRPFCYIQYTENNMKATIQQNIQQGFGWGAFASDASLATLVHNLESPKRSQRYQGAYNSDRKMTVVGSSQFGSGKHSWKVCISGNFTAGFAFGVGVSPGDLVGGSQWTWSSGHKYEHLLPLQESAITNCMNNDVIEFYLDCDNETLMMYNERTRQLDTWRKIQGEVHPLFELYRIGDQVTLPCQPNSSLNETFEEDSYQEDSYQEDSFQADSYQEDSYEEDSYVFEEVSFVIEEDSYEERRE